MIPSPIPCPLFRLLAHVNYRCSSSSSSRRWIQRQGSDTFARQARVAGLRSRAAFKLLQINDRYRLFKSGQTVVDLGYAPGSWAQVWMFDFLCWYYFLVLRLLEGVERFTLKLRMDSSFGCGSGMKRIFALISCLLQVAVDMTKPSGRVLGVDMIPAQPPKGVSTIQGNFLSAEVQASVRNFLRDPSRGRVSSPKLYYDPNAANGGDVLIDAEMTRGYVDRERQDSAVDRDDEVSDRGGERTVDVVLSDMCEPWEQTAGFFNRTLSDPYLRMMNTSGNRFRDHAGSMVSHLKMTKVESASDQSDRIYVSQHCTSASTR